MKNIVIIGAGTIGQSIAINLLQYGYSIILIDNNSKHLEKAKIEIQKMISIFSLSGYFKNQNSVLNNIIYTEDYMFLEIADIIIENIYEDFRQKKDLYMLLDNMCKTDCLIVVNTSCIPIAMLSQGLAHREKMIGIHFMNPCLLIDTVEVIISEYTSKETENKIYKFLSTLNKQIIKVNDFPGFISNRLSHLFINEAANIVYEKKARAKTIDSVFKSCFGHSQGPLETADLIGLDTVKATLDLLFEFYKNDKFLCSELINQKVENNELGIKTKKGFYSY